MNKPVMVERIAEASPRPRARITGVVYLLYFLTAVFSMLFLKGLVVYGDAASTANNILAHQPLFRLGIATGLIATACYVAVTALFYDLFKPMNKSLSLVAAFISFVGCAMGPLSLFHLVPLHINSLVFFGFYCLLIGYLIFRSNFLPRILGVLMAIAGLGWLTFLWPSLAAHLTPYVFAPGFLGEGALTLWLLAMGVNAERWNEQSGVIGRRV